MVFHMRAFTDWPTYQIHEEALERYGKDLTELARRGKLDPVIGRDDEIGQCVQILLKRRKNPVIIGEPGVGKTAIAEGLAQRIVWGDVPEPLKNRKLISLNMGSLLAGAKSQGDLEARLLAVSEEVAATLGEIILFIDDIHILAGAGAICGAMDAWRILKPMLTRGELRCIGATTLKGYRKCIGKDPAFRQVLCNEPSVEDTISILRGLRERYERHHVVKISDGALVAAAELSHSYIRERFLPDKAIDLIDQAAAAKVSVDSTCTPAALNQDSFVFLYDTDKSSEERLPRVKSDWKTPKEKREQSRIQEMIEAAKAPHSVQGHSDLINSSTWVTRLEGLIRIARCQRSEVTDGDIAQVVSKWTGIPLSNLQQSVSLEQAFHKRDVSRSRPIASFMFMGLGGVGKTEFAKDFASYFFNTESAVVRIDMSEFTEKHAVSRLVGAPPGCVGHEDGGQLTEAVCRRPCSVVLFDEIEKAHHDVLNILLQLLDEGRITDSQGRTVSFTNSVVIMTSNIGSREILQSTRESEDAVYELMKRQFVELARQTFRPELMNRIDEFIVFQQHDCRHIVEIQLNRVKDRLKQKKIDLRYTQEAVDILGKLGSDPARPVKRVIQQMVENEIAMGILKGDFNEDDTIILEASTSGEDDGLRIRKTGCVEEMLVTDK